MQSFDKEPKYTEVNPSENVMLDCVILNKKGTCLWQKNNRVRYLFNYKINVDCRYVC